MDQCSTPACPLYGNTGTVIVRLKMEVSSSCCKREECPASGCPELVHSRPSGCEQCTRTRLISQYNSDCDSDVVTKSRPYRSSAARSRYVNVCAAVCLLLLVCGLSPRSSAAPHRSRSSMERQRRDTSEENPLWADPCDYGAQVKPNYTSDAKKIAWNLATQARNTFTKTESYKETFAKLHSFPSFNDLLQSWDTSEYLPKEWLPKEKVLNQTMPEEYIEKFVKGDTFDTMLPGMYKGLKMIVAGLNKLHDDLDSNKIISDESLKNNINKTMHDVRAVLCYFNGIMNLRNLTIEKLLDSEIPSISNDMGFLLYRDTLKYLEYLEQVFLTFHKAA